MACLESIWIYPVKSLGAVRSRSADATPAGLRNDRRWMVVDPAGDFLTRRRVGRMATVAVSPDAGGWRLSSPGAGSAWIPLEATDGPPIGVRVWKDALTAVAGPADADAWLSKALGAACRLVFLPDEALRTVRAPFGRPGDVVSFADAFPVLLVGRASLDELNGRLPRAVSMRRFRPNLVVSGAAPFAEDAWHEVRVGPVGFENVKPCVRCVVVDRDPDTGERSEGVLSALAAFRRWGPGVRFGVNLVPRDVGRIAVGDAIDPL